MMELIFVVIPVIVIALLVIAIAKKIAFTKSGVNKADYPEVLIQGKMRKVHPDSFAARSARKKGLLNVPE